MSAPWEVERFRDSPAMSVVDAENSVVCYGIVGDRNASLIAAAPELAEALKYIVENCRIFCADSMDCDDWALRDAVAALAKAGAK